MLQAAERLMALREFAGSGSASPIRSTMTNPGRSKVKPPALQGSGAKMAVAFGPGRTAI